MIFDERLIYPTGFTPGPDEEMNFSFSSKLNLPFESLVEPPSELDGKNFFRALQVACSADSALSYWHLFLRQPRRLP
jgi:hypothetical protein